MKSLYFNLSTLLFFLFSSSLLAQEQSNKTKDNSLPGETTAQLLCPPIVNPITHSINTCGNATVPLIPTFLAASPSAATHSLVWSTGSQSAGIAVTPTISSVYTCTLTELASGCDVEMNIFTVTVLSPAFYSIVASSTTICEGKSAKLTATGAIPSATWSTGELGITIDVTPSITTIYSITVSNSYCSLSKSISITVLPAPLLTTNIDSIRVCKNESIQLIASGATNYTWSTGSNAATITLVPTSYTTVFVEAGHSLNACTVKKNMVISVDNCTTNFEHSLQQTFSISYDNSSISYVSEDNTPITLSVMSLEGKLQYTFSASGSNNFHMPDLAPGIYIIQATKEQSLLSTKRFVKF